MDSLGKDRAIRALGSAETHPWSIERHRDRSRTRSARICDTPIQSPYARFSYDIWRRACSASDNLCQPRVTLLGTSFAKLHGAAGFIVQDSSPKPGTPLAEDEVCEFSLRQSCAH